MVPGIDGIYDAPRIQSQMIIPAILYTFKGKLLVGISAVFTTIAVSEIVLGQLVAAIPPTLAVLVTLYVLKTGQNRNAQALDGKLDAFMDAKVAAGKAAGREEERVEARARQGEAAIATQAGGTPTPVTVENNKDNPAHVKHAQ